MASFTESVVEEAALAPLESLGYAIKHGPDISSGGELSPSPCPVGERTNFDGVVATRAKNATVRLGN
jgi:hypothetical protein